MRVLLLQPFLVAAFVVTLASPQFLFSELLGLLACPDGGADRVCSASVTMSIVLIAPAKAKAGAPLVLIDGKAHPAVPPPVMREPVPRHLDEAVKAAAKLTQQLKTSTKAMEKHVKAAEEFAKSAELFSKVTEQQASVTFKTLLDARAAASTASICSEECARNLTSLRCVCEQMSVAFASSEHARRQVCTARRIQTHFGAPVAFAMPPIPLMDVPHNASTARSRSPRR